MKHEHVIASVEVGSIAEEMGIEAGDKLISVNDTVIEDVFDYHFCVNDEEVTLLIQKENGEEWELEIEKDYEEVGWGFDDDSDWKILYEMMFKNVGI